MASGETIMNINSTGHSQYSYVKPTPIAQGAKIEQIKENEHVQVQQQAEIDKGNTHKTARAEGNTPASSVEAFTYGALGMDHPDEVKNNEDDAYTAGQVLSALGTIGAVLAIVV